MHIIKATSYNLRSGKLGESSSVINSSDKNCRGYIELQRETIEVRSEEFIGKKKSNRKKDNSNSFLNLEPVRKKK